MHGVGGRGSSRNIKGFCILLYTFRCMMFQAVERMAQLADAVSNNRAT